MNDYQIDFEFFDAVDGNEIPETLMQRIHKKGGFYKRTHGREMLPGEAGCALSHLSLYKKIVDEKLFSAVILEDDIDFDHRLKSLVAIKSNIPGILKKFDLVLLGYCGHDLNYRKPGLRSYHDRINFGDIQIGHPIQWNWSTIGYLISFEGAEKLLQQGDLPLMQADFLTANSPYYGVKLGIVKNQIVWPGPLNDISLIGDRFKDLKKNMSEVNSEHNFPVRSFGRIKGFYLNFRREFSLLRQKLSRKKYPFIINIGKVNK